jgi:type IV pilus assembly protein PilB
MKLPFVENKRQPANEESPKKDVPKRPPAAEPVAQESFEDQSIRGLSELYCPQEESSTQSHVRDIADVLLETGNIAPDEHARVRQEQLVKPDRTVEAILLAEGISNPEDLLMGKARLCGLDFQREPANAFVIEEIKRQTQMDVRAVVCPAEDIKAACEEASKEEKFDFDDIMSDMGEVEIVQDEDEDSEDLEKMAGQSPIIKFVNYLISNAVREGASDIHIEPKEKTMKIRCRIDGVLFETMQSPLKMHPAVVSRIKIMANLDISERRLPQDGKITVIVGGRGIDLRVSTLPTSHGEKVVIRVLDSKSVIRGLEHLGMETETLKAFRRQIALPHGILLVTGPTGSGKSTTLYSALCQMDGEKTNISTVEDPVEYELDFCNQVQANEKIGLSFGLSLRSLLRQDPDIIMIGEIRDSETARIAVQAALTGHLVLSTLHTNDAASSVTRLVNIGIDPYLIAASLNTVLAQRLVRKICPKCKEPHKMPKNKLRYLENANVEVGQTYRGAGCDECRQSGYQGRIGIYELLIVDEKFREGINKDPSANNMRNIFLKTKQPTLFDDGMRKVNEGLTTIEEVLRVTEVYGQTEEEEFVENIGE